MRESKELLKIFADGLKSLAMGIEEMAEKVEGLSCSEGYAPAETETAAPPVVVRRRPGRKPVGEGSGDTAGDAVLNLIARTRKGIDIHSLKEETGFDDKKIYNIIYRLKKQGKITIIRKGVYVKA